MGGCAEINTVAARAVGRTSTTKQQRIRLEMVTSNTLQFRVCDAIRRNAPNIRSSLTTANRNRNRKCCQQRGDMGPTLTAPSHLASADDSSLCIAKLKVHQLNIPPPLHRRTQSPPVEHPNPRPIFTFAFTQFQHDRLANNRPTISCMQAIVQLERHWKWQPCHLRSTCAAAELVPCCRSSVPPVFHDRDSLRVEDVRCQPLVVVLRGKQVLCGILIALTHLHHGTPSLPSAAAHGRARCPTNATVSASRVSSGDASGA